MTSEAVNLFISVVKCVVFLSGEFMGTRFWCLPQVAIWGTACFASFLSSVTLRKSIFYLIFNTRLNVTFFGTTKDMLRRSKTEELYSRYRKLMSHRRPLRQQQLVGFTEASGELDTVFQDGVHFSFGILKPNQMSRWVPFTRYVTNSRSFLRLFIFW